MPVRLVSLGLTAACLANGTLAASLADQLAACRSVAEDRARLACFDRLGARPDLELDGKGSAVTDLFEVIEPRLLRFASEDAIMVVYLLDGSGAVVQNLHRGGAGEGEHLIERPGTYRVQVNATGGWSLRLEVPGTQ